MTGIASVLACTALNLTLSSYVQQQLR